MENLHQEIISVEITKTNTPLSVEELQNFKWGKGFSIEYANDLIKRS